MWKDNDDKIMDILENIETLNRQDFPVVCPICGGKDLPISKFFFFFGLSYS